MNANQLKHFYLSDTYSLCRDVVSLVQTTLPNCLELSDFESYIVIELAIRN